MTGTTPSGREYERTHPWIDFSLDIRRLDSTDWLALGACASMCERIAAAPLDPGVAEAIHKIYLAKGALATTAIEGNTLSEEEARARIEGALELPPSQEYLGREIDNIVDAYNEFADELGRAGGIALTAASVARMNGAVLRGLEVEDYVVPGRTRTTDVSVGAYRCPGWRDAAYLLDRLCAALTDFPMPEKHRLAFAILKAVFAHIHLAWIHPFGDGNGRTARLVELAILLEAGLPQPACHLLSNHYNRTRTEYYRQLARASRTEGGIYGFVSYAIAGLADGLREQIGEIREHQWGVAWIDFIHREFGDPRSVTERRRRMLAVSLAREKTRVKIAELTDLNPALAREYAKVTYRTLFRDVRALIMRELVHVDRGGVASNRERVLAFLPWRNAPGAGS